MTRAMHPIVDFYSGTGTDHRGRSLSDIFAFTDDRLETEHDFIQWLFPLPERSPYNPHAPTLDRAAIDAFQAQPALRDAMHRAFVRMLAFYRFELSAAGGTPIVVRAASWPEASANWMTRGNHNFLRISRIMRSMMLLGQRERGTAFLAALEEVYATNVDVIGSVTIGHWRKAVRERA